MALCRSRWNNKRISGVTADTTSGANGERFIASLAFPYPP